MISKCNDSINPINNRKQKYYGTSALRDDTPNETYSTLQK